MISRDTQGKMTGLYSHLDQELRGPLYHRSVAMIRRSVLEVRHLYNVVSSGGSLPVRASGLLDYSASTTTSHTFLKFARFPWLSPLLSEIVQEMEMVSRRGL